MTQRKKQVKARCGTAGVWDQASRERFFGDNVGKIPLAAGAGSDLRRLFERSEKLKERRARGDWRMSP